MHTEAIEDLVEEVRVVILKLDRIACALEQLTNQLTQPPTLVDPDRRNTTITRSPWARQLDHGRAE